MGHSPLTTWRLLTVILVMVNNDDQVRRLVTDCQLYGSEPRSMELSPVIKAGAKCMVQYFLAGYVRTPRWKYITCVTESSNKLGRPIIYRFLRNSLTLLSTIN